MNEEMTNMGGKTYNKYMYMGKTEVCSTTYNSKNYGWYSRKVTNFSKWLTREFKSPVLWNTTLYHIYYIWITVIL